MSGAAPSVRARIDELVGRATARTGLDDFGGDSWRAGLEVLVGSALTEAEFDDFGEQSFHETIVRTLTNRLEIEDWYRRHPEIDDQDVHVELLGVGFPRTGSTALAAMLGEDPDYRNLRTWEETAPCPPPGLDAEADATRIEAARQVVELGHVHMAERLRSMLPRSATGPMEDHDLMALEFTAQYFLVMARVPTYARWFLDCDMEATYRYERRVLKLLQWQTPEKVWRLKSPTHTLFLAAHETVFPGTRYVQTHRDVAAVLPSVCDLYDTMLRMGNPTIDPHYVGDLNVEQWGTTLDRLLAFRTDPERDAKFLDLGFTAFQADPIAEIRRLYDWLGADLTPETMARMEAWRAENPRDRFGRHEYDGATFGLTDERLATRFGAYRARFGPLL